MQNRGKKSIDGLSSVSTVSTLTTWRNLFCVVGKKGRTIALLLVTSLVGGCAQTVVQPRLETRAQGLQRPDRILVFNFAVSTDEVSANQGVLARVRAAASGTSQEQEELEIGRQVSNSLAEELVKGIQGLGLPAERASGGTPIPPGNVLLISGHFLKVDEGNQLRRTMIGFGAGQSSVDTQVQVSMPSDRGSQVLLNFSTHADSGEAPGAAATMGVGAAATGGVSAAMAAANAGVGVAKTRRGSVESLANRSADQTVAYLSEFFAKQGWISADKVKTPKLANE
jgi:hypothetical protein